MNQAILFGSTFNSIFLLGVAVLVVGCLPKEIKEGAGAEASVIPADSELPVQAVCDPFGSDPRYRTKKGIVGQLFSLSADQPRYTRVLDYIQNGHFVDVTLFLSNLNVPTRPFDRGFVATDGTVLTTSDGTKLYEYFALHLESRLRLGVADPRGRYQLALLADDGATLRVNDSGSENPQRIFRTLVDDDGVHPTRMACSTSPVEFNGESRIPMTLDYFQGPRYHISLILMWRPWPVDHGGELNDPLCGKSGNSLFFDSTQSPPKPQKAYQDLLSRGWKVLEPENFELPEVFGDDPCGDVGQFL